MTNGPTLVSLGIDAGGTHTRWALADTRGALLREGEVAPFSGLQLADETGRAQVLQVLRAVAAACGPVQAVAGGITGFDDTQAPLLQGLATQAFGAVPLLLCNDIELLCRAHGAPGHGIVLIAGTGSVAAGLDAAGTLQRAGGRGLLIDDAGGGAWIAREALQQVWRAEDVAPGAWEQSPLARALFEAMGGTTWAQTRHHVYGATRGELGTLALAVARAAHAGDAAALAILQRAGQELARLLRALAQRLGAQPVVLAGRVFALHPAVLQALQQALPGMAMRFVEEPAHHAAARLAARLVQDGAP